MTATQIEVDEQGLFAAPTAPELLALCHMDGPCLSIFLPAHRAGSGTQASATTLTGMLPALAEQLDEEFLAPVVALTKEPALLAGHRDAICIYRSKEALHCFFVRAVVEPGWHLEEHCVVNPVLEHLDYRQNFLLLALAGKHVRLLRCEGPDTTAIALPEGVPESAEDFTGDLHGQEHTKNHAPGVRFGSSEGREKSVNFRHDFMKVIDRGLQPMLREEGLPLVLAGLPEETSTFQSVSGYSDLLPEAVRMSPDGGASVAEMADAGAGLLKRWSNRAETAALAEFAGAGPAKRRTDGAAILKDACAGRVQHLFVQRGTLTANAATVEVLLHKGRVWLLEPDQMPEGNVIAAVLRYADEQAGA